MKSFFKNKFNNLSNDRLFGEIFKGSLLVFITKVGATVIGLITSVIVARWYGAEVVGVVALISSYLSIIALPAILGTDTSVLRLIPEQITKYSHLSAFNLYKKTRYLVIVLSLIIGIILALFSSFIAEGVFKAPELTYFFMAASILLVFRSLQQFSNQGLRAVNKINAFAFIQVLMPVTNLILLVILTYYFYDLYNPVYIQFFLFVFIAIIGLVIINKAFKEKIEEQDITENVSYKTILGISFPMFLTSSMLVIIGQLATIMIGMFRSAEDVGYYAIALRISTLTTFVLMAINTVVAPKFSALFNEGKIDDLFYVARKSTKLIFWSVLPLILIFVFFGKWIIMMLYGPDFEVSYYLLLILSIGLFINAISGSVGYFMNMCGFEKQFRNTMLISLVASLLLNLLFIPSLGVYGAAIVTTIIQVLWNLALTFFIYNKFDRFFLYVPFIFSK